MGDPGENSLSAGLVNYDMTPKKAFTVLKRLIQEEWTTRTTLTYQDGAANMFRGFYGDYEAVIDCSVGTFTRQFRFSKNMPGKVRIALPG